MTAADQSPAGAPRKRAPVYSVFVLREFEEPRSTGTVHAWVLIAENVAAPNDRDAITAAASGLPEDERYGTFWAPIAGTLKPRKRGRRVTEEDVWEDA